MGSDMDAWLSLERDVHFIAAALGRRLHAPAPAPRPRQPPVILVVGDSLSAEYGLKRGTGWVALLEQRLAQREDRRRAWSTPASAATPPRAAARACRRCWRSTSPTHVVIELGANDALRGLPLAMTEDNLAQMTQAAQKAGAQVLLVGMQVPPNYGSDYAQPLRGLFEQGREASTRRRWCPSCSRAWPTAPTRATLFQADRIHPQRAGAAAHAGQRLAGTARSCCK